MAEKGEGGLRPTGLVEVTLRINEIEISMEITVGICGLKRRAVAKSNRSRGLVISSHAERVFSHRSAALINSPGILIPFPVIYLRRIDATKHRLDAQSNRGEISRTANKFLCSFHFPARETKLSIPSRSTRFDNSKLRARRKGDANGG